MISNGFQARLLKDELISIEETFAITPACSLFEGKDGSSASSPSELPEQSKRLSIFPSISVDCYTPALRPKAISVVRRGAVFVTPQSSASRDSTMIANETPPSVVDASAREGTSKLFLAFRWVGAEHINAQSADVLGDIGEADLQRMKGVGLVEPAIDSDMQEEGKAEELDPTSSPLPVQDSTLKIPEVKEAKRNFFSSLLSRKKTVAKQDQKESFTSDEKLSTVTSLEHPILVQVYFDNQLLPLIPKELDADVSTPDKLSSTVQLRGGALLDLQDIGLAMPDAAANEILHTITLHLWDATRKDIEIDDSFKPGQQIEWSPKQAVVPNVIFHFEVVSSGPSEADEVATPSDQAFTRPTASLLPNNESLLSGSSIPLYTSPSQARLASVAEEDTFRSMDEGVLTGGPVHVSRHTKMRRAASIAASALKPKQRTAVLAALDDKKKGKGRNVSETQVIGSVEGSSETVGATAESAKEKNDDAANTSVMKTLIRKVEFKRPSTLSTVKEEGEAKADASERLKSATKVPLRGSRSSKEEAKSTPEVFTMKVDGPQTYDTPPNRRSSLQSFTAPLSRASSTGSNRFDKMLGRKSVEAKRASLMRTDSSQHKEICQNMNKVEELKREHILIEKERRLLEEQWSKALLKSLNEDVTMLEKRIEDGKREVDVLRKRISPAIN